jgi:hypothetical protein
MKRTKCKSILALLVLFAMIVSVFVGDTELLRTEVAADDEVGDIGDDGDTRRIRVEILYNGDVNRPIANSGNDNVGRDFNSFVPTGQHVTLRAVLSDGTLVPDAQIYYTTSNTTEHGARLTSPGVGPQRGGGVTPMVTTVNSDVVSRVFNRHAGGVPPNPARAAELGATGSRAPTLYTGGPISIPARVNATLEVFTISAAAVAPAGSTNRDSHAVTRTFLLTPEGARRDDWSKDHGELMIFSLYTDSFGLFDSYEGILPPGVDRQEWIDEYRRLNSPNGTLIPLTGSNPHEGARTRPDFVDYNIMEAYAPTLPANYNRRGRGNAGTTPGGSGAEKEGFVEMFDHNGRRHIAQSTGFRVKGGWSRGTYQYEQRTFEFYARNGYNSYCSGGRNTFVFPLFEEQHSIDGRGNLLHKYRRFRVRNGGSDRDRAFVRDELGSDLARMAGYPVPPQNYRPAVVFLNGAYYGGVFMKSPRTENAWDRVYSGRESNIHHLGSNERGSVGCISGADSCGRIIPNTPIADAPVAHFMTPAGSPIMAGDGSRNDGLEIGNFHYVGRRPVICGVGSARCSGDRLEKCRTFHGSANSKCGGFRDPCAVTLPDGTACASGNRCAACRAPRRCDASRPGACARGGACTGCRATCDWDSIVRLIWGEAVTMRDGTEFPDLGGSRLNPNGLSDNARWEEFKRRVDVESMMLYYACSLYVANIDWPANNQEMWRYFPDDDEIAEINAGTSRLNSQQQDQKWRWIAQDLEMGFAIWTTGENTNFATNAHYNNIGATITRGGVLGGGQGHYGANLSSFMMRAALGGGAQSTNNQPAVDGQLEARVRLANAFSDIMDGPYVSDVALAVHGRIAWFINAEHQLMLELSGDGPGPNRRIAEVHRAATVAGDVTGRYAWPRMAGEDGVTQEHSNIQRFLRDRPAAIRGHIARNPMDTSGSPATAANHGSNAGLGLAWTDRSIAITMQVDGPGYAVMNTRPVGMQNLAWAGTSGTNHDIPVFDPRSHGRRTPEDARMATSVTGNYFAHPDAPIPLTAHPTPGFRAVWSGATPVAGNPNRAYVSSSANVTVTFERCPNFNTNGNLDINTVRAESFNSQANDWMMITNFTGVVLCTKGKYLTDSNSQNFKFQMPAIIIQPGQSVMVRTQDNTGNRTIKGANTNFNLGFGERLRMMDFDSTEIVRVEVSIMRPDQVQHRDTWTDGYFRIRNTDAQGNPLLNQASANPGMGFPVFHGPPPVPCDGCGQLPTGCNCPCPGGCGQPTRNCQCPCVNCNSFPCNCCPRCNRGPCVCPPGLVADLVSCTCNAGWQDQGQGNHAMSIRLTNNTDSNDIRGVSATMTVPSGARVQQVGWGLSAAISGTTLTITGSEEHFRIEPGQSRDVTINVWSSSCPMG